MRMLLFALVIALFPAIGHAETAYERIQRTGTIRCGYVLWSPYLIKDPNTGGMSGLAYDYMSAIANELDLKLEWTEETGWGTFQEGLNTGRYDLMCVPVFQSGQRARIALLSTPLYYGALLAYARADDTRFDGDFAAANKPDVTIADVDGDATQAVRRMLFPNAKELAFPQMSDTSMYVLSVVTGKADIVFINLREANRYNETATVKVRPIAGGKPVRLFGVSLAMKSDELALKAMLDSAIETVVTSGAAAHLVAPYAPEFSSPAPGYGTVVLSAP